MTAEIIVALIAFLALIIAWVRAPAGGPLPSEEMVVGPSGPVVEVSTA